MDLTPKNRKRSNVILPERVYRSFIKKDLQKKMVFIGGPRQVGKTTLAKSFINDYRDGHPSYLNWDNEINRSSILKGEWSKSEPIVIFDEIHKRKTWQSMIKGFWDTWKNTQKFIVTGSARLDVFRKGGDSMLGRYHYYRLHPFSLPELGYDQSNLHALFKFGGFPEPLLEEDEREHRRWHLQRVSKLVRTDLRDLENVSDLDKVEMLANSLESRVSSPLSIHSFSEDLEVSDKTIKRWIKILDSLYYCFLISPYGASKMKAAKKSQKLYLWDWSGVEDLGARFENMVASHLLKYCDFQRDVMGYKVELRYIRDDRGRECDFVVLKNNKPLFAVECKLNDNNLSSFLPLIQSKLEIPRVYQVFLHEEKGLKEKIIEPNLMILSFSNFCKKENLI